MLHFSLSSWSLDVVNWKFEDNHSKQWEGFQTLVVQIRRSSCQVFIASSLSCVRTRIRDEHQRRITPRQSTNNTITQSHNLQAQSDNLAQQWRRRVVKNRPKGQRKLDTGGNHSCNENRWDHQTQGPRATWMQFLPILIQMDGHLHHIVYSSIRQQS